MIFFPIRKFSILLITKFFLLHIDGKVAIFPWIRYVTSLLNVYNVRTVIKTQTVHRNWLTDAARPWVPPSWEPVWPISLGQSSANGCIAHKVRKGWFDLTPSQLLENMSLCPVDAGFSKDSAQTSVSWEGVITSGMKVDLELRVPWFISKSHQLLVCILAKSCASSEPLNLKALLWGRLH